MIVDSCRLCIMMSNQYPSKSSMLHSLIIKGYINRTDTIVRNIAKTIENNILIIVCFKIFIKFQSFITLMLNFCVPCSS